MNIKWIFAAGLCSLVYTTVGQQKHLQVGDTMAVIPYTFFENNATKTAKLPNANKKMFILDFWATWCTSCIKALPKLDSLQNMFKDELDIIMVNTLQTGDTPEKISRFFDKWEAKHNLKLSLKSITQDSVLVAMFPHSLLPHYVWIDENGKVIALTSADQVTAPTIRAILDGVNVQFNNRKEQSKSRPLFTNDDLPLEHLKQFSLITKGRFEGLGSGNRMHYNNDTLYGRAITNTSLYDLYLTVARAMEPNFQKSHFIVDSTVLKNLMQDIYTLEVIVPVNQAGNLYTNILTLLNQSTDFYGRFEKKRISTYIISGKPTPTSPYRETEIGLMNEHEPFLQHAPIRYLINRLNNTDCINKPVMDETGFTDMISMTFPDGFGSLEKIIQRLNHYGLNMTEAVKEVELFIVTPIN